MNNLTHRAALVALLFGVGLIVAFVSQAWEIAVGMMVGLLISLMVYLGTHV